MATATDRTRTANTALVSADMLRHLDDDTLHSMAALARYAVEGARGEDARMLSRVECTIDAEVATRAMERHQAAKRTATVGV